MTSIRLARSTDELARAGGALDLGPDRTRLVARMFHLLAGGRPVSAKQVDATIAELGIDLDVARQLLDAWTEQDTDGNIVGLGVTLNRTPHRMTIGTAQTYAWCAIDTLILSIILEQPIAVVSEAPGTGESVRLQARPDGIGDLDPADAVITWPARDGDHVDVESTQGIWTTFCHHSFLFPTRDQAEAWAAGRDDIEILTLPEGFEVARQLAGAWLRYGR
jgi:hypothetical protein